MRRLAIMEWNRPVALQAAAPPRDRTTRIKKGLDGCREAWQQAFDQAIEQGKTTAQAVRIAAVAYKLAMPPLDSLPAIRAHIATVAQGIQLEVFTGRDGSQLLYAAQVAMALTKKGKR